MAEQLSRDLPVNDLDILGELEAEIDAGAEGGEIQEEITPEAKPEETTAPVVEEEGTQPDATPEAPEVPKTEDDGKIDDILGDNKEIKEDIADASGMAEDLKETLEEAKDAIDGADSDEAGKLIDDLYKQVIEYSAKLDSVTTKNAVLETKLEELSTSNAEYQVQVAQTSGMSNDPKMLILNRMYDGAVGGEQLSKDRVITVLEDMYYQLKGQSFDETRIDKVSDANAGEVVLNNITPPEAANETEEETDINDITSIF